MRTRRMLCTLAAFGIVACGGEAPKPESAPATPPNL
jgi:hypothetical protein